MASSVRTMALALTAAVPCRAHGCLRSGYDAVNGVPSCANDWLLKDVARGEWGFEGYVTSDCDAITDAAMQTYEPNATRAVAASLKAGTDNDCGGTYGREVGKALTASLVTEALVDERLVNLWQVRLRLGHFDPVGPLDLILPGATICTDEAIAVSMQGVIQGATLLKNSQNALPLTTHGAGNIAVLGPNANYSLRTHYYGPQVVCNSKLWTALDAVSKYAPAGDVVHAAGVPNATSNDTSGIPGAVAMASKADTVVLVLGTSLAMAEEGHDAAQINFTAAQQQLIDQTLAVAKKPVVVLLMTAVPLDVSQLLASPKVGAILHLGQPSVAILGAAELIYGRVSPASSTPAPVHEWGGTAGGPRVSRASPRQPACGEARRVWRDSRNPKQKTKNTGLRPSIVLVRQYVHCLRRGGRRRRFTRLRTRTRSAFSTLACGPGRRRSHAPTASTRPTRTRAHAAPTQTGRTDSTRARPSSRSGSA